MGTLAQAQGRAERVIEGRRAGQWAGPGEAKGPSYGLNLLFFFTAVLLQCKCSQGPCIYHVCVLRLHLYTAVTVFGSMAILASGLADDLIFLLGSELCSEP